jgi:hypothetical protein
VRVLRFSAGLGALLLTAPALAAEPATAARTRFEDHPLRTLVEGERGAQRRFDRTIDIARAGRLLEGAEPRPVVFTKATVGALDAQHAKHDIELDPMTGATVATMELRIKASGKALSALGFVMDEGLSVTSVSLTGGRSASFSDEIYSPSRVTNVVFDPGLQPGEETTLTIAYSGTLACGAYPEGQGVVCTKGKSFSYFAHQSIFPYLYDPQTPYATGLDSLTREIVMRVPEGTDVVATGEFVSDSLDGQGKRVSTWTIDKPLSRSLGMYVFAGKLGLKPVPGRAVPTTLVFPAPEQAVDGRLSSWSSPVLDFVEKSAGTPLPFQKSMSLVRLPSDVGDPGTATFGMTLLSESYSRVGDLMHEETWAHENSHLFWGIVVPELDTLESRLMSEGMATLTEIDYSFARHFSAEDRDLYLARRFVPIGLDIRLLGKGLPAVHLAPGESLPDQYRTALYTLWAYYKTAATLDHLRVTVGDDVFASGINEYVKRCSFVGCNPDDLKNILTEVSGKDLAPFFSRWVTGTQRPQVVIGFAPTGNDGADVELTKADDKPMTLELWLRLDDGKLVKRRVDLGSRTTNIHLDTPGHVLTVAASPRHDLLVDAVSALDGDLDFDGETDGLDLIKCTRLVGKKYESTGAVGLWNVAETFDPRCDLDGDFDIDEEDIANIASHFGTLRDAP